MKARRVHILGGPGSGKTYLAEKLGEALSASVLDLDEIFWDPAADSYNVRNRKDVRDRQLQLFVRKDAWIVEGVYFSWLAESFSRADVIVILTANPWLRSCRITKRYLKRRLGLIQSKKETFMDFWRLIQWNHQYDRRNLCQARGIIRPYESKTVVYKKADDAIRDMNDWVP